MPYTKGNWVDRVKAYPNRYILEEIGTGSQTDVNLYANEGDGVDGTPFNKSVMDDLENRVGDMFPVKIEDGGTGSTTAENARINLGVYSSIEVDTTFSKADLSNVTNENFKSKADAAGVGGSSAGGGGVGKDLSGKDVKPTSGGIVKAKTGAEIFNDYRDRTFDSSSYATAGNVSSGSYSHAEGTLTTASGNYSHAEGYYTTASSICSHSEGNRTKSSHTASHAEGYYTTASGESSHAEGYYTTAIGSHSHAEGDHTTASGSYSHAEGSYTTAIGNYSHASGSNTTSSYYQFVCGIYNVISDGPMYPEDTSGDIFIIGGGTSASARKNALRTTIAGKTYGLQSFQGSGADYAEYFEWEDGNPYNEDRRGLFVTVNGEKVRKANFGDFIIGVISSTPTVVGDTASEIWDKMYLKDVFGDYITEEAYTKERKDEEGNIIPSVKYTKWILNPEYDSTLKYENRESRNEWACVGLVGKLVVIDDGTCEVNGFCTSTYGGKATSSDNGYRVLKRIDSNHIKILLK